jgi:hypothetical protein
MHRVGSRGYWSEGANVLDLINHTPFPAMLTRFGASEDVMGASLVVRVTYHLLATGLVRSEEQTWIVSPKPWDCEYGPMEADTAFYKGGTDIFLFGSARAPKRRPVTRLNVVIEVGKFRREIVVFGERAWLPRVDSLVASAPQPFIELPLTMANAYGGRAEWDGLQVPYTDNPEGKGFFIEQEQAVGKRLPNIEDPRALISRWDQRPAPVGVGICPLAYSRRIDAGTAFAKDGTLTKVHPRLFNAAFPEMVAEAVKPSDQVRLTGVSHEGPVIFALPHIPAMFTLSLDSHVIARSPTIDQIGIELDKKRVFITYRYPFRYILYQRQQRKAELLLAGEA